MKYKNDRDVPGFYLSSESTQDGITFGLFRCIQVLCLSDLHGFKRNQKFT